MAVSAHTPCVYVSDVFPNFLTCLRNKKHFPCGPLAFQVWGPGLGHPPFPWQGPVST